MDINKLNKANNLRSKIRNLEYVLNDYYTNGCETFCTFASLGEMGSKHTGTIIDDLELCKEIRELIKNKLEVYRKEFEEL